MYGLHQGHNDWYRIRNQRQGPAQLHIYDEIGYFGVSASDLVRDLADVEGPLEVHLNSPGGEVFDGIAIYNALIARKDVTVMIDGIAASIASVIAMAGNPVLVARQGTMMVHDGFGMSIGNADDMREMADLLDRTSNNIASIYSDHTGRPADYWREIMRAETWYNGQEAIDSGLADRFIDSGAGRQVSPPQDSWDLTAAFRGPREPRHAAPPADPEPDPEPDPPAPVTNVTDLPSNGWTEPTEEEMNNFLAALKGA
jgi:ATP-dependent protease ClpP protease subunit